MRPACEKYLTFWSSPCWIFFEDNNFSLSKFNILSSSISRLFRTRRIAIFILVSCSQKQQNIVRCNILFGVIGQSGFVQDINIAFFLSDSADNALQLKIEIFT